MARKPMGQGLLGQVLKSKGAATAGAGSVAPLTRICTEVIISVKDDLRDVGYLPTCLLRPILQACTMQQLKTIENETRLGSGRGLKWDTWDLWRRHFLHDFGQPEIGTKVPPLLSEKPPDYDKQSRPADCGAPGDWRKLYEEYSRQVALKQESSALKLRMRYQAANDQKRHKTAQISQEDAPPAKRRSIQGSPAGQPAPGKGRLMSKLGINKRSPGHTVASRSATGSSFMTGGAMRGQQLAAARPVRPMSASKGSGLAITRRPQKRAGSAPPPSHTVSAAAKAAGPSAAHPKKRPFTPPAQKPAARMEIGSLISGMKAGIQKSHK